MAASSDDSEEDNFVVIGTPLPPLEEGDAIKKPTTIQDLTARDKQGRRRFHGAFTGGFSAGYFNTVGSKEGFTPSTFVSSRSQKKDEPSSYNPEDFMDDEDLEEYGITPRKFTTQEDFTSEERKRKFQGDVRQIAGSTIGDIGAALSELIVPGQLTIGVKLLRKMGWKEGQGLGPRVRKKRKKKGKKKSARVYGCALPPSSGSESDESDVPSSLQNVTFAPKDQTPFAFTPKDDTHGLGYRGLDPSLALPASRAVRHNVPVSKSKYGKGIRGQAFGVGAFEDDDDDIYTQDNMSNYDLTMSEGADEAENLFGWTAPRSHGKQTVPVSYVGKLLDGFSLSSKPLLPQKKFPPPALPKDFKPVHWFRKKSKENAATVPEKLTAVDRGLLLGETPIMGSVFDLVPNADKSRISSTIEAIAMTKSLKQSSPVKLSSSSQEAEKIQEGPLSTGETTRTDGHNKSKFLSKFTPASDDSSDQSQSAPLFQGAMGFQPFRRDQPKQARYDRFLASLKQGIQDPYTQISDNPLTEWEKSRERDEFSMASRLFRPMSAMMSARFVESAVMDDTKEDRVQEEQTEQPDHIKAAEMKMFGKLTREEFEWHPDKLVCKRFNVPNPYPGSDIVGLTTVKRDKYSVFTFLNFGDYQPNERKEAPRPDLNKSEKKASDVKELKAITPAQKKAKMASIFSVLDDPDFHKPQAQTPTQRKDAGNDGDAAVKEVESGEGESEKPDIDLFRAIFKNSDSEDSDDASVEEKSDKDKDSGEDVSDERKEEENRSITDESAVIGHSSAITQDKKSSVGGDQALRMSEAKEVEASVERMSNPFASVFRDAKNKAGQNRKSVFSVLDELSDNEKDMDVQNTEDNSEMFGPCLPPPAVDVSSSTDSSFFHQTTDSSFLHQASHSHKKERKEKKDVDGWRERKEERDTEKIKSKKSKKKKSKLKKKDKKHKKHKKKSSKHKSKKSQTDSSGSDADTESSGDGD